MSESLAISVVEALARADRVSPDDLDYQLYEFIDPEVFSVLREGGNCAWELSFEVADHTVTVTDDEMIFVNGVRFDSDAPNLNQQ